MLWVRHENRVYKEYFHVVLVGFCVGLEENLGCPFWHFLGFFGT